MFIKKILLLFCLSSCFFVFGQTKPLVPFDSLLHKTYTENKENLEAILSVTIEMDSEQAMGYINSFKKFALLHKNKELELEAEFLEYIYRYAEGKRKSAKPVDYCPAGMIDQFTSIANRAASIDAPHIQLRAMKIVMDRYVYQIRNYELAFEITWKINHILEHTSSFEFPDKCQYYLDIANLHYQFRDYKTALSFYHRILKEPETSCKYNVLRATYNGLGLIYTNQYGNLERSDSCFRAILNGGNRNEEPEWLCDLWTGIVSGNLGINMVRRGEPDKALPMLEYALQKTLQYDDYNYASGQAIALAEIYLQKQNPVQAKKYITQAEEYIKKTWQYGKLHQLYPAMAKYYALIGNHLMATAYIDSTTVALNRYNENFSSMQLLRAEQRSFSLEQQLNKKQLQTEKNRSKTFRTVAVVACIVLLFVACMLALYRRLYYKKKEAYRELVIKSQEWANVKIPITYFEQDEINEQNEINNSAEIDRADADTTDVALFDRIALLMTEKKPFTQPDYSLDMLSQTLGVSRNYISGAINHCTGRNYTTYINEHRIKEAIRLLSQKDIYKLSIDGIASDSGFGNRQTFHRVFKNLTGLSPATFRENLQNTL